MLKHAVVALIEKDNLILGVSRKDNPNDFGLPGGKIENNETIYEAVVREVREETGLEIKDAYLFFKEICGEYLVYCYRVLNISGEINTTENGQVKYIPWNTIMNGSFSEYNKKLYETYLIRQ